MTQFLINYAIIPPGVGPDDYEPADLEHRAELFEFPDATPSVGLMKRTVEARLPAGSGAAILSTSPRTPADEG